MEIHSGGTAQLRELFYEQVPELANGVVEIKGIAREPGSRSMMTVCSRDPSVDPVGVCVGDRGSRVRRVVQGMSGELVDIVRWSGSVEQTIRNVLAPAIVQRICLDPTSHKATVTIDAHLADASPIDPLRLKLAAVAIGWQLLVEQSH